MARLKTGSLIATIKPNVSHIRDTLSTLGRDYRSFIGVQLVSEWSLV